jgi:hypothetical protein
MKTYSLNYVHAVDIIPKDWNHWFWGALNESSTTTFGDNDYSIVSAERFLDEVEHVLSFSDEVPEEEVANVKAAIEEYIKKDIYINL